MNSSHYMLATAIVLAVTGIALLTARRLHVGSIVALLAVGLLAGPHSPYPVFTGPVAALEAIGEIGVMLLLFTVALDIEPARLWAKRRLIAGFGSAQVLVSALAIAALLMLVASAGWKAALVLGLAAAMSSSAISLPLVVESGATATRRGRAFLAADIFQSFMVAPVLMLIPILGHHAVAAGRPSEAVAIQLLLAVAALGLLAHYLMPLALRQAARALGSGAFTLLVLGGVLLAAWITQAVGLSSATGAFVMGILLSSSVFAGQIKAVVAPAKQAFLALFFLSIGMAIDPVELFGMKSQLLLFLPGIFAVKLGAGYAVGRFGRLSVRDALLVSLLLLPLDEVAYVIFASARDAGLLDAQAYAVSLSVLSLSFIVAPLAINLGFRLAPRPSMPAVPKSSDETQPASREGLVLQIGYGQLGRALCAVLERAHVPYLCIDDNLDNLAEASRRRHKVRFGYVNRPSSLSSFRIPNAKLVVVAADDFSYAKRLLGLLREFHPGVPVQVAVPYLAQREELRALGFTAAFAVVPEGALTFGQSVLDALGVEERCVALIIDSLRSGDFAALRALPDVPAAART